MFLAASWCRRRASTWSEQLDLASTLGFQGLGLLQEASAPQDPAELQKAPACGPGQEIGALDADCLRLTTEERPAPEALVAALRALGCRRLLLRAGLDQRPEVQARGQALLDRVRRGESVSAEDEAAAEFHGMTALDRERQLEDFLRYLTRLRALTPGLPLLLQVEASPAGLLDFRSLQLVYSETSSLELGYWHDTLATTLREAVGGDPASAWLDAFAARCGGATLEDCHQGVGGQPPGTGIVDWQLLREYLPQQAVKVLHIAPSYPGVAVEEARASLQALALS